MWPIFAADDSKVSVTLIPADCRIEARLKQWNGRYYLTTANASEEKKQARIRLDDLEGMEVKKLFNLKGDLHFRGNVIEDTWGKDDAFVYEISASVGGN